jgi:ketosteroid isomerase-like protein
MPGGLWIVRDRGIPKTSSILPDGKLASRLLWLPRTRRESCGAALVNLWEHVNFWTAVGSIGLGALLGLAIGLTVKEAKRLMLPPDVALPYGGVCPACQTRSLRRRRGGLIARLRAAVTGRWPYACSRCGWHSNLSATRGRHVHSPRPRTYPKHEPLRLVKLDNLTAVAAPVPVRQPAPVISTRVSDEAAIEAAVLQHIQTLNLGDLDGGYASGATNFGLDGGPRTAAAFARPAIDMLEEFERPPQLRVRDLRISIHKDAAVATGYLVGTVSLPGGGSRLVVGRSTFVHVRQSGVWKLAHSHLSPFVSEASGSLH